MTQAQWTDRCVTGHGIKIHLVDWGSEGKFPMLLIHGFSQTAHTWDEFAPAVCDRYHVYAMDQRGHGDSDWTLGGAYKAAEFVADIAWKYDPVFRTKEWSERREAIDLWSYFRRITCPTLIVRGAQSDVFASDTGKKMVEVHPNCRMVEVEGAGHSVMGDNPAGFRAAVEAFLAERP